MGLFRRNEPPPPNTVSDSTWGKVRRAAAKEVPYVDGPWVDPEAAAKKSLWGNAPQHADDN